jgi:putative PEP-CTERM system histidine kinase
MQTLLAITAISLAAVYLLYFNCRKGMSAPPLALSAALLVAALLELFDLLALLNPAHLLVWKRYSLIAEAALPPVWLWFSLRYARQNEPSSLSRLQRFLVAISPLFVVSTLLLTPASFFYSPDFATERILFLGNAGFYFYILLLVYLIVALINLEMTLTSVTHSARWKIKFELLGAGAFLAVLVFYYSQGLLFRTINMNLVPARTMFLIVALVMMAYSRLRRGNGVKVYVSRQVFYRSVVLLTVGLYMLGLGLMGEGMKYFGDGFQRAMTVALAFVAGLGLVITLLSETARRKIQLFIHRNFYRNKYDYRNQWLQFTDRLALSMSGDDLLRSIVIGFCETFGMGCGALFLADLERETFRFGVGVAIEPTDVTYSKGDAAIERIAAGEWVDNFPLWATDVCTDEQMEFFRVNGSTFAVPLLMKDELDGFIVLGRPVNEDETYNYEDFDLMKTLARQASATLLNVRLSEQLALSREMAAIGKVSAFVMHDLKNHVAALSLMLENAREHIDIPEFQLEMLVSLGNTVTRMNTLISRLQHLPEKEELQCTPVDLLQLARETAALVSSGNLQVTGHTITEISTGTRSRRWH